MSGGGYGQGPAGQAIFTDDVSLQVFMEHLKRLVSHLRRRPEGTLEKIERSRTEVCRMPEVRGVFAEESADRAVVEKRVELTSQAVGASTS
jgi:hypothetical protein